MLRRNLLVTRTAHPEAFAKTLTSAFHKTGRSLAGATTRQVEVMPSEADLEVSVYVGKTQAWAVFHCNDFTRTELLLVARACVEIEPSFVVRGFSLDAEIDRDEPSCVVRDCAFEVTAAAISDLESPNQQITSEKTDHWDDVCDCAFRLAIDAWIDASNQRSDRLVSTLYLDAPRKLGVPRLDSVIESIRGARSVVLEGAALSIRGFDGSSRKTLLQPEEIDALRPWIGPAVTPG